MRKKKNILSFITEKKKKKIKNSQNVGLTFKNRNTYITKGRKIFLVVTFEKHIYAFFFIFCKFFLNLLIFSDRVCAVVCLFNFVALVYLDNSSHEFIVKYIYTKRGHKGRK